MNNMRTSDCAFCRTFNRVLLGTFRAFLLACTRRLVLLACVLSVMASLAHFSWYFELAVFMRHIYMYVCLGSLPVLLFFGSRKWALIAAAVCVVNGALVVPLFVPARGTAGDNPSGSLRILTANVFYNNEHADGLLALVEALNPDIVCLQEFHDRGSWKAAAERLRVSYPYTTLGKTEIHTDSHIFSRHEAEYAGQVRTSAKAWYPFSVMRVKRGEQWITVATGHIAAINDAHHVATNNADHEGLARFVRETPGLVIVTGDFNQSPWSPRFRCLQKESGLQSTRKGFGIRGTFPLLFNTISLPIDHILVSPDIQTVRCWVGGDISSDHRPLVADVLVP